MRTNFILRRDLRTRPVFKLHNMRALRIISGLLLAFALGRGDAAELQLQIPAPEPAMRWDRKAQTFSAAIDSLSLKATMAKISALTGWKVYVDPSAEQNVSAQFSGRPTAEALRLLLGGLNFAVVPQKGGPSKLMVFRKSAADATEAIEPAKEKPAHGKDWIKNEMIVSLTRGSKRNIDELARLLGAKIVGRNDKLRTYRLQFDTDEAAEAAREQLASNTDLRVDDNYAMRPPVTNGDAGAPSAAPFDLKATANPDGSHTIVAVIDTAIQGLDQNKSQFLLDPINVAGAADPAALSNPVPLHGTSMIETLLESMAANAGDSGESNIRIRPINVYGGAQGSTTTYEVTLGFYAAVQDGARIVSMSMGGDGDSPLLDNLIDQSRDHGVRVFAAAGNTPTTEPTFPAAHPNVYGVTASGEDGNLAYYANRGAFVDLIAPGTSYIDFLGTTFRITGTSPATATVAGAAASYIANGHTVQQMDAQVQQTFGIKKR